MEKEEDFFKIEKGLPLPPMDMDYMLFPFHKMVVGDSFFVLNEVLGNYSSIQTAGFLYTQAKNYKRFEDMNAVFSIRRKRDKFGVRVFKLR